MRGGFALRSIEAHARCGETSLHKLRNLETNPRKRVMLMYREAREKDIRTYLECLGVSQEDTTEGSL